MSGDSSGSEDDNERLREAVDSDFLTENLYNSNNLNENYKIPQKSRSLLRRENHQKLSTNPFSLNVTPEFQKHVSKHLSKLLDELIDDTEISQKVNKSKIKNNSGSGVKLLASSKDYLLSGSDIKSINKQKLKKKNLNKKNYEERAKKVAVTPEWILSQEEIRHWTSNKKEVIETVKLE